MKPTLDTAHHWSAAKIAAGNARLLRRFDLHEQAAKEVTKAREHQALVKWDRHVDTDESGFDV